MNVEKSKYMLIASHLKAGPNRDVKTGNKSIENASQFKYLDATITNQNFSQEGG
jgi:hypothetical protein